MLFGFGIRSLQKLQVFGFMVLLLDRYITIYGLLFDGVLLDILQHYNVLIIFLWMVCMFIFVSLKLILLGRNLLCRLKKHRMHLVLGICVLPPTFGEIGLCTFLECILLLPYCVKSAVLKSLAWFFKIKHDEIKLPQSSYSGAVVL